MQKKEDGTRLFPDKPETESMFEESSALAMLLINEVIFINDHHWASEWPADAKAETSLNVNCGDVFAWGFADAEGLSYNEIESLYEHYEKDQIWGPAVWCIKKRKLMPQKPIYEAIQAVGIWNLDEMGLEPNRS